MLYKKKRILFPFNSWNVGGMLQAGALSPDGKILAVGGFIGEIGDDSEKITEQIRLINLESCELIGLLKGHTDIITDHQQHPTTQKPSTISRFPIVQIQ